MAEISKAVSHELMLRASLAPGRVPQDELADRIVYVADMEDRAAACGSRVLASCYQQIAKMVLQAEPRDEVTAQARALRAKARLLGSTWGDNLRRQADALEAANPAAPRRGTVRKAAGETTPVLVYDCNGRPLGVVDDPDDITPVADPDVITKAASVGMVAAHDETGKLRGFVHPDKVRPVATLAGQAKTPSPAKAADTTPAAPPKQTAPAAPPASVPQQQAAPVAAPSTPEQVIKSLGPAWMPVHDWQGRLGGAVRRADVTALADGQVLKGAAASSRANVYDARRRRVGTAPMARIVHLADLPGQPRR